MQYAITASFAVWVTSIFLVFLKQVKLFPRRAVETFEGGYIICFSAIVIAIQLCTLAALRKHNNAVAQKMEESSRVNPNLASQEIERQLAATTHHVVSLLGLCIIPIAILVGLSNVLQMGFILFVEPLYFPVASLCSSINPVLYYKGNSVIREGIKKPVNCHSLKCFDSQEE